MSKQFLVDLNKLLPLFTKHNYLLIVLAHAIMGLVFYYFPFAAKGFSIAVFVLGIFYIVKNKNANQEVLLAAAYVVGCEIILRMTAGANYQFAKYAISIFALLGMYFSGFSKKSYVFVGYLLLLVPGLLISFGSGQLTRLMVNDVISDFSGPICLGIMAIYTFGKKITFAQLSNLLLAIGLPIVSACCYVYAFSPSVSTIWRVESNKNFSGMFGPNQVATAFGFGVFIFFLRAILNSKTNSRCILNLLIASFLCYNGLLTFSRGGMIAGVFTFVTACCFLFWHSKSYGRLRTKSGFAIFAVLLVAIVMLINFQTDGIILKRYTNRTMLGQFRPDKKNDRSSLAKEEVRIFAQNPILGVGTTEAQKIRFENHGKIVKSHNEITRLLSEQGLFGLLAILILFAIPILLFCYSKQNVLLGVFFTFWFLTINHSGMRLSTPAFVYALMLLHVDLQGVAFFTRQITQEWRFRKRFVIRSAPNSI